MTTLTTIVTLLLAVSPAVPAFAQAASPATASWLSASKLVNWNKPGADVPAAPAVKDSNVARCVGSARPPELKEDTRVQERGWHLVGGSQSTGQVVVIRATADYDGMCRPRQYQDFVFVRGAFAGTLSPQPMDSRSDGAIGRLLLQSPTRLTAEYQRYTPKDALCCPSSLTTVVFEIAKDGVVRPKSARTSGL